MTHSGPRIRVSEFRPAWWLPGAHLQTIFANLFRRRPRIRIRRERIETPDGDFFDVDWCTSGPRTGPLVLILHGLEGSSRSLYAVGLMRQLRERGIRSAVVHFRGCSGEPNRRSIGYHSGWTHDLNWFVGEMHRREPGTALAAVGYSLGGNVLLKYLGETGSASRLRTAVAVSVPFRLDLCADAINRGFSRAYQAHLLRSLKANLEAKFSQIPSPLPLAPMRAARTFRRFDDVATAPLHGFRGADDYYRRSSSRQFLRYIDTPTLVLHSRDDPFMTSGVVPAEEELSSAVTLELSDTGGHVGFVGGAVPFRPHYWLEDRIGRHMTNHFDLPPV